MTRTLTVGLFGLCAMLVGLTTTARAAELYTFEAYDPSGGSRSGNIDYLSVAYDTREKLSFEVQLGYARSGREANSGWFVLSDGGAPTYSTKQHAIFYLDFEGGDVYTYRYNGVPYTSTTGYKSYRDPSAFIASYQDVLSVTGDHRGKTVSFSNLDISSLAAGAFGADWKGAAFDTDIGGWFHFAAADPFTTHNGKITNFTPRYESYYDFEHGGHGVTAIPEPSLTFGVLGLGLAAGLVVWRRRKSQGEGAAPAGLLPAAA